MQLKINNDTVTIANEWQDESLLNVLREHLGLVGCKFGCGIAQCGACSVLVDDQCVRSCVTPARSVEGKSIQTIEGLANDGQLHPVQTAWITLAVPQCGYCQAGQIMGTIALLKQHPKPTDKQIDDAMSGHLCRCATQQRIRDAIKQAAGVPI